MIEETFIDQEGASMHALTTPAHESNPLVTKILLDEPRLAFGSLLIQSGQRYGPAKFRSAGKPTSCPFYGCINCQD